MSTPRETIDFTDEDDEEEEDDDVPPKKPADSGRASVENEDATAATVNPPTFGIPPRSSSFPANGMEQLLCDASKEHSA